MVKTNHGWVAFGRLAAICLLIKSGTILGLADSVGNTTGSIIPPSTTYPTAPEKTILGDISELEAKLGMNRPAEAKPATTPTGPIVPTEPQPFVQLKRSELPKTNFQATGFKTGAPSVNTVQAPVNAISGTAPIAPAPSLPTSIKGASIKPAFTSAPVTFAPNGLNNPVIGTVPAPKSSHPAGPFKPISQVTKKIYVNHAFSDADFIKKLETMWKHLSSSNPKSFLSVGGNDKSIFVQGDERHVLELEKYIDSLDKPITQIRIDAIILYAQRGYNFDVGIDWSGIYNRAQTLIKQGAPFGFAGMGGALTDFPEPTQPVGGTYTTGVNVPTNYATPPNTNLFVDPTNFAINLFNKVLNPTDSSSSGSSFIKIPFVFGGPDLNLRRLSLVLNAAERESKVKIVSRPSILTGNGMTATVKIGQQLPMQYATSSTTAGTLYKGSQVVYKDIGIMLEVKPTIAADKQSVNLEVNITNIQVVSGSTVSNDSGIMPNPPVLSDLSVKNNIVLRNGQTTVIGGLAQKTDKKNSNRIPILYRIPILGNLFKAKLVSDEELEEYIFITPTIVDQAV